MLNQTVKCSICCALFKTEGSGSDLQPSLFCLLKLSVDGVRSLQKAVRTSERASTHGLEQTGYV